MPRFYIENKGVTMCLQTENNLDERFKYTAVKVYNDHPDNSKVSDFTELQEKLKELSPVACKDQYFGIIKIEKSNPSFCEWIVVPSVLEKKSPTNAEKEDLYQLREKCNISERVQKESLKTIAIILESPHTDEFLKGTSGWKPIGPACGTTGRNLRNWLPEVLLNYVPCIVDSQNNHKAKYHSCKDIESGVYAVKLINAVQYQCSLGEETTKFRDLVFSNLWECDGGEVKESFSRRLNTACPNIVINCCTKGYVSDEQKELRYLVQKEITTQNKKSNSLLLRAAHPSSLYFKNGLYWVDED